VVVFVAESVYIFFASVRETVGVLHRSCVGWGREVAGSRRGIFLEDFRHVGWGRCTFCRCVCVFNRVVFAKFKFQVGLVVGVS
jgi:hypothetical protein